MIPALPFDPLVRAAETEAMVMQGNQRRYYRFRGIAALWRYRDR
jgi:uncharacterized Fe-S cluster-containing radical SAM superfamily protein